MPFPSSQLERSADPCWTDLTQFVLRSCYDARLDDPYQVHDATLYSKTKLAMMDLPLQLLDELLDLFAPFSSSLWLVWLLLHRLDCEGLSCCGA